MIIILIMMMMMMMMMITQATGKAELAAELEEDMSMMRFNFGDDA